MIEKTETAVAMDGMCRGSWVLGTACGQCARCCEDARRVIPRLCAALAEISKGEGAFSRDQLTFANNCIESMKQTALDALAK